MNANKLKPRNEMVVKTELELPGASNFVMANSYFRLLLVNVCTEGYRISALEKAALPKQVGMGHCPSTYTVCEFYARDFLH
jgi:hypothetical protein